MFRTAFSTVACPDWTLQRIAQAASDYGYDGVELRTFGSGSTEFACDPALTAPEKVLRMFQDAGVAVCSLATSVAFDAPIVPPVLGRVADTELSVRQAKSAIDMAAAIECPFVRVFGFEFSQRERRASAVARIRERLALAADAAHNLGVRIVVENGGSFSRAPELLELIHGVRSSLVGASYSNAVAAAAGEDPLQGVELLADRLWTVKLRDRDSANRLCEIGQGVLNCPDLVRALFASSFRGPLIVEWDRAWLPALEPAESVLPRALRRIYEWTGLDRATTPVSRTAVV